MKKSLPLLLTPLFLFSCAPFKVETTSSYTKDVRKLYSARQMWESQQRTEFQLKQLYLQVFANRKAIRELNRQIEKQNQINKEFAGRLLSLEREISNLERKCSVSNSTSPKGGKQQ